MTRAPLPSSPGRKRLIEAARAEYQRLHRDLGNQLAAIPSAEMRNVNVAQNVLRDVLSALLNEMAPYSHETVIEMSRRLASYALSTAPLEDQDAVVAEHLTGFADFHLMRTAIGAVINSTWRMEDGRDLPNFPEAPANSAKGGAA